MDEGGGIQMAGIDAKFTAHSTRAASISVAKTKGASVSDILKAGIGAMNLHIIDSITEALPTTLKWCLVREKK